MTAIFRTSVGPLPAYRLAPMQEEGEFELARPLMILSESKLHAVTRVCVHPYTNFVIMQGLRNWTAVPDGVFYEGMPLDTILAHRMRLTEPEHRVDIKDILNVASLGAMHSCNITAGGATKFIEKLKIHEFRTESLQPGEYGKGLRFILPVQDMKVKHFAVFLYAFICVSFRFYKFRKTSRNNNVLSLTMRNIFWRDYISALCLMFGIRVRQTIHAERTFLHFDQAEFAQFCRRVFTLMPDMPYRDFKMLYTMLGSHVVVVDEKMQEISQQVDNSPQPSVERVEYSVSTATCPGVSFPELSELVEANSMIVRGQHESAL